MHKAKIQPKSAFTSECLRELVNREKMKCLVPNGGKEDLFHSLRYLKDV